jgi:hypothetical protein
MFFQEPFFIYTIAAFVLFGLAILEMIAFFTVGLSMEGVASSVDSDISIDSGVDSFAKEIEMDVLTVSKEHLSWSTDSISLFNVGKVPFVVILALFSAWFSGTGIGTHIFLRSIELNISNFFVLPMSFAVACIGTFFSTKVMANVLKSEDTVVSKKEFIGEVGTVVIGEGDFNKSVQVKLVDKYKSTHYIMVRMAIEGISIKEKDEVIILKETKDGYFKALPKINKNMLNVENSQEVKELEVKEMVKG